MTLNLVLIAVFAVLLIAALVIDNRAHPEVWHDKEDDHLP